MDRKKTKVLVTGGAGYIGSILVGELIASDFDVTVLDNFLYRQGSLNHLCACGNFRVVRGDCRDCDVLKPLVSGADFVIPLAAIVGAPACDRDKIAAWSINRDAIETLIGLCSKQQRIIIPTTNSGYGIGQDDVFCTEETPLNPLTLYGKSKIEAEKIVLGHGNSVSLRLATVFGMSPRMRIDLLVNDFTYRAMRDRFIVVFEGHFKRNYIHIRDVARAFLHVMERFDSMKNQAYNVGLSDANISKLELCARIKKHVPDLVYMESQVGTDPDKRNYIVSNDKIEKAGFKATYSLDVGITELVKGYSMLNNTVYGNV